VPGAYETKCPLCGAPRAKGQKRCLCNYTFEYDRESGPFRRISEPSLTGARGSRVALIVVAVVLVLAAGGVVFVAL
jgi:hypothetical protein